MMNFLFHAHSGLRYLVLLAAVVALVLAIMGWTRGRGPFDKTERTAMAVFVGVLDLQLLLGLVLLFLWPFYGALIGHIVMMVVAVAVAHMGSIAARRREPTRPGSPIRVAAIAAALFLIVGGVMAIGRSIV